MEKRSELDDKKLEKVTGGTDSYEKEEENINDEKLSMDPKKMELPDEKRFAKLMLEHF